MNKHSHTPLPAREEKDSAPNTPTEETKNIADYSPLIIYNGPRSGYSTTDFLDDLNHRRYHNFMARLRGLISLFDYMVNPKDCECRKERHFQFVVGILFTLMGLHTDIEVQMFGGRTDCVIVTPTHIIIMEFKVSRNALRAIRQIEEKCYDAPYHFSGREIVSIGIHFNVKNGLPDKWLINVDGKPWPKDE